MIKGGREAGSTQCDLTNAQHTLHKGHFLPIASQNISNNASLEFEHAHGRLSALAQCGLVFWTRPCV